MWLSCEVVLLGTLLCAVAVRHADGAVVCKDFEFACKSGTTCLDKQKVCDKDVECAYNGDATFEECVTEQCRECQNGTAKCFSTKTNCSKSASVISVPAQTSTAPTTTIRATTTAIATIRATTTAIATTQTSTTQSPTSTTSVGTSTTIATTTVPVCLQPNLLCNNTCLKWNKRCNGIKDCPNGEDEKCSYDLKLELCGRAKKFLCENEKCVNFTSRCDGRNDCGDGSDEKGCCPRTHYRCVVGTNEHCIERTRICGKGNITKCGANVLSCTENPCLEASCPINSICRANKTQRDCSKCKKGYIGVDSMCLNINECKRFDSCSQACEETAGTFRCACTERNYKIICHNGRCDCKSKDKDLFLLYNAGGDLFRCDVKSRTTSVLLKGHGVDTFDFDQQNGYVFYANNRAKQIVFFDSHRHRVFEMLQKDQFKESIVSISYDWVHKLLFWADTTPSIHVGRVEGTDDRTQRPKLLYITELYKGSWREEYRSIVVYPPDSKLFWTVHSPTHSYIAKASMNGENSSLTEVVSGIGTPGGLSLDDITKHLYWGEKEKSTIKIVSLDGKEMRTVIGKKNAPTFPTAMTMFERTLFWISNQDIYRADKLNGRNSETLIWLKETFETAAAIRVDNSYSQRHGINKCHAAKCPRLCLPVNHTYSCIKSRNGDIMAAQGVTKLESSSESSSLPSGAEAVIGIIVAAVLAAVLLLAIWFGRKRLYAWKSRRYSQFNNPSYVGGSDGVQIVTGKRQSGSCELKDTLINE